VDDSEKLARGRALSPMVPRGILARVGRRETWPRASRPNDSATGRGVEMGVRRDAERHPDAGSGTPIGIEDGERKGLKSIDLVFSQSFLCSPSHSENDCQCLCQESNLVSDVRSVVCGPAHSKGESQESTQTAGAPGFEPGPSDLESKSSPRRTPLSMTLGRTGRPTEGRRQVQA
jgi:hypothetical protein